MWVISPQPVQPCLERAALHVVACSELLVSFGRASFLELLDQRRPEITTPANLLRHARSLPEVTLRLPDADPRTDTIKDFGLSIVDSNFDTQLNAAYQAATAAGLWQNTMAARYPSFCFPGGVMDWYDANLQADPPDGVYNSVNTRAELEAHDPTLAAIIAEQFVIDDWRPRCP